ncbi:MAG: outer membrane beta-barrel protein [Myxococcota bacterium]|nr:outer membrane beta-barrel protein [Myxococcota bacterium]
MKRTLTYSILPLLLVLGMVGEAMALDGWRDRRGLFTGIMLGGGSSKANTPGADSNLGYNFGVRIGGGISKVLTLDASLGLRLENYSNGPLDTSTQTYNIFLGANFFAYKGMYVRATGGISQFGSETGSIELDETGLGLGAGAGYEFFATSDLAVGIGGEFLYQKYDDFNINVINFGISATWY